MRHQIFEIKDASCGVKANACVFVAYDRDKPDIAAGGIELCNEVGYRVHKKTGSKVKRITKIFLFSRLQRT